MWDTSYQRLDRHPSPRYSCPHSHPWSSAFTDPRLSGLSCHDHRIAAAWLGSYLPRPPLHCVRPLFSGLLRTLTRDKQLEPTSGYLTIPHPFPIAHTLGCQTWSGAVPLDDRLTPHRLCQDLHWQVFGFGYDPVQQGFINVVFYPRDAISQAAPKCISDQTILDLIGPSLPSVIPGFNPDWVPVLQVCLHHPRFRVRPTSVPGQATKTP